MPITMLAVQFWALCASMSRAGGIAGHVLGSCRLSVRSVEVVAQ
jgi:hypothetical protein